MPKEQVSVEKENPIANASSQAKARVGMLQQMRDVLITFLPSQLKQILERGLFRAFLYLIFFFVICPPLIVWLAAFWMSQLEKLDNSFAKNIRKETLQTFYEGFSVEEVAARSNIRLDYFQLFEVDLTPKKNPSKKLRINIQRGQKASLDIKTVKFFSTGPECTLPEKDIELLTISLGEQHIKNFSDDERATANIELKWWTEYLKRADSDNILEELSFSLTGPARNLPCGQVHVNGSISVYKDLLPLQSD